LAYAPAKAHPISHFADGNKSFDLDEAWASCPSRRADCQHSIHPWLVDWATARYSAFFLLAWPERLIHRIEGTMSGPESRFYESQGLRLHYADWGNEEAPPLILIHGGRDHCRSWDAIARSLQPHFHVLAPDLRGHGDSDWTKGGSYALTEYVYDLTRLVQNIAERDVTIIGHSMGGWWA
jgi:predicted alpha/beta-fold hydrolase